MTTGTNPFTVTNITGTNFTVGGTVNRIQLQHGLGYTCDPITLGTVRSTSITGTKFNLTSAKPGFYFLKVSKDNGSTWSRSLSPMLFITPLDVIISGINPPLRPEYWQPGGSHNWVQF